MTEMNRGEDANTLASSAWGARTTELLCHLVFKSSGALQIRKFGAANQVRFLVYLLRGAYFPLLAERPTAPGEDENWRRFLASDMTFSMLLKYFQGDVLEESILLQVRNYLSVDRVTHLSTSAVLVRAFEGTPLDQLLGHPFLGSQEYPQAAIQTLEQAANHLKTFMVNLGAVSIQRLEHYNHEFNGVTGHRLKPQPVWFVAYDQALSLQLAVLRISATRQGGASGESLTRLQDVLSAALDLVLGREVVRALLELPLALSDQVLGLLADHSLYFLIQAVSVVQVSGRLQATFDPRQAMVEDADRTGATQVLAALLRESGNLNAARLLPQSLRELLGTAQVYAQHLAEPDAPRAGIGADTFHERWLYRASPDRAYTDVKGGDAVQKLDRETRLLLWARRVGRRTWGNPMNHTSLTARGRLERLLSGVAEIAEGRVPVRTNQTDLASLESLLDALYDCRMTGQGPKDSLVEAAHEFVRVIEAHDQQIRAKVLLQDFFELLNYRKTGAFGEFENGELRSGLAVGGPISLPPVPGLEGYSNGNLPDLPAEMIWSIWNRARPVTGAVDLRADQALLLGYLDAELLDAALGLDHGEDAAEPDIGEPVQAAVDTDLLRPTVSFASIETFETSQVTLKHLGMAAGLNVLELAVEPLPTIAFLQLGLVYWCRVITVHDDKRLRHAALAELHSVSGHVVKLHLEDPAFVGALQDMGQEQIIEIWLNYHVNRLKIMN